MCLAKVITYRACVGSVRVFTCVCVCVCVRPIVEARLAEAVRVRDVLKQNEDVIEMDAWGIDMYTRRNVYDGECCNRTLTPSSAKWHNCMGHQYARMT